MKPGTPFNRSATSPKIIAPARRVAPLKLPWRRRVARRSMIAAVTLGLGSICAEAAQMQHVDVMTHASQGEVKLVKEGGARLVRSADGIFVNLEAEQLKPNHAYTMWVVAINAPNRCSADPCPGSDVMQKADHVEADLGYGDGAVAGDDGKARFAAFQPAGAMPHSWFGRGLTNLAGEIHLVIRDHGPLVEGREADMLATFREGCNAESVPDTLPGTARGNGHEGDYPCANIQAAIFEPLE
ncbi:MAG: hypothetical protein NXI27_17085 [Alphaproteobacteria bacterium]|nr:hypothetical protein [Alphaproteobacteria bacterium]